MVELMIVVAIIAILASIAFPAYQAYTVRARVAEAMIIAGNAKTTVMENIISNNALDADSCEGVAGLVVATANVASLRCTGLGVIEVSSTAKAGSVTLNFTPVMAGVELVGWHCERVAGSNMHVSPECRS